MIGQAKSAVKAILRRFNRRVVYVPAHRISGFDLRSDLCDIIGNSRPVFLDVGANAGQTIDLLRSVFGESTIHAFEPSTKIFDLLSRRHAQSKGVHLYHCALGNALTSKEFVNYKDPFLSSFLEMDSSEENRFRTADVEAREIVEVKTVDWFLSQNHIDAVDLLKIDTQGFDLEVLRGASESLKMGVIRNVLIEINFVRMYEGQGAAAEICDFLLKHDFHLIDYYEKVRQKHTLAWCTALFGRR